MGTMTLSDRIPRIAGQKLVLRARLTFGTELGSRTEFPELAQFSSVPPRSIFTGQKLVLRARLTLGTELGPGSLFLLLVLWGVSLSSTMGTMTFWDRIPRIGPILQRTPQEHFHRTKTRFKGAFDFGDRTGPWLFILIASTMGGITF